LEHLSSWKVKLFFPTEKWSAPDSASFKVNFDTAIRENFSAQSAICRDHNGKIVKAIPQISPSCDPLFGEALATALAISLAVSLKLRFFHFGR
jgi:hypothetical protein